MSIDLKRKKNRERYYNAKRCAKERNIAWQFTLQSWLDWWGDDIDNRGCHKGQLVMARIGDIGPYHPDNVRKITCLENHNEAHIGRKHTKKHKENRILSYKTTVAKRRLELI